MVAKNKHLGSDFETYVQKGLRESEEMVFYHMREAIQYGAVYTMQEVKRVIAAKKLELGPIAKSVGITRQGLHRILTGKAEPSAENFIKILRCLGLSVTVEKLK